MLDYNNPPKPGEVTLDREAFLEVLFLPSYGDHREALLAAAGYFISNTIASLSDSRAETVLILEDIMQQAGQHLAEYHIIHAPLDIDQKLMAGHFRNGLSSGLLQHDNRPTA
jgi:hypothetical protein